VEYVIWGTAKGKTDEEPLYTKAETMREAKRVQGILERDYGATKCRIQVLDFRTMPNFAATINTK